MLPQVTHQSNDSVDLRGGEKQGSTENATESASEQVKGRWGAVAQALSQEAEPATPPASQVAQWQRIRLPLQETWVRSLGQEDPLEKEMATCSSILAWEIPKTEEPGRL